MNEKSDEVENAKTLETVFSSEYLRLAESMIGDSSFNTTISHLVQLHEREVERKFTALFAKDMAAAQSKMKPVLADEENTQSRTKYSSLAAIDHQIRTIYTEHGFAPTFGCRINSQDEDHVTVYLDLMHSSGMTKHYEIRLPADGKGAQGKINMTRTHAAGSAYTYAQRYLIKQAFNVVTLDRDDDDGDAAGTVPISWPQLEVLKATINEVGADMEKFKKYLNVKDLADLPAVRFDDAMGALEIKKEAAKNG